MPADRSPYASTVPLATAMQHLVHVVKAVDPDGIRVAAQRVKDAGSTLDFCFDDLSWTPLTWVAWSGHADCLRALLDAGADPDFPMAQGHGALHRAVAEGRLDAIAILVEHGASLDRCNEKDESPRSLAARDPVVKAALERAELHRLAERIAREAGDGRQDRTHRRL